VGISASVWAINTMLQLLLKKLVLFEKVDSRTSMVSRAPRRVLCTNRSFLAAAHTALVPLYVISPCVASLHMLHLCISSCIRQGSACKLQWLCVSICCSAQHMIQLFVMVICKSFSPR
jgi:hypothetical protein